MVYAWRDNRGDVGVKGTYKFPHHFVAENGDPGSASTRACSAIIAVLNGGRGGANIPDSDRRSVYNHAARHLRDADKEVPELKSATDAEHTEHKMVHFSVKQLTEDGTFEGLLSPYGEIDDGGDVVEPGSFTKTIEENAGRVPLLWQHKLDEPIGRLELKDTEDGVRVKGTIELGVQRGKEAHTLLKNKFVDGLSIGFRAVQKTMEKGVRHLREIKLFEGSIVTLPMASAARIDSVKADFRTEFERRRILRVISDAIWALDDAIWTTIWDTDLTREQRESSISESISDFHDTVMEVLPDWMDTVGIKAQIEREHKERGSISEATRQKAEEFVIRVQELLSSKAGTSTDSPVESAAVTTSEKVTADSAEPDDNKNGRLPLGQVKQFCEAIEALRD
jgi:HK97 family phage prohead protease